jgi:hypothetical protein
MTSIKSGFYLNLKDINLTNMLRNLTCHFFKEKPTTFNKIYTLQSNISRVIDPTNLSKRMRVDWKAYDIPFGAWGFLRSPKKHACHFIIVQNLC